MPVENIGGISVSVQADLGEFQAQLNQAVRIAETAGQEIASALSAGMATSSDAVRQLGQELEKIPNAANPAASSIRDLGSAASSFGGAGLALSTLSAGIFGLGAASLEAAGKFEQWDVAFTRILGSAQAAKSMMADLVDFAIRTPFEIPGVVDNAQKLMAFGFAAKDVIPILTTLGDQVSMMGKGAASLNSLTLAFGEMSSKGVVQLRQLNMLTLQGVPALEILARAYGVSTQSISDSITKKLIPAAEAIPKLLEGMAQKSSGMMELQSQTFTGMLSNLADAATKTEAALGETMLPAAKDLEKVGFELLNMITGLAKGFGELPRVTQDVIFGILGVTAVVGPLLLLLAGFSFALKSILELPAAFGALKGALGLLSGEAAAAGTAATVAAAGVTTLATAEVAATEATTAAEIQITALAEELAACGIAATAAGSEFVTLGGDIGAVGIAATGAEAGTVAVGAGISGLGIAAGAAGIAVSALIGYSIGAWAYQNIPGVKSLADEFERWAFTSIPGLLSGFEKLTGHSINLDPDHAMEGEAEAAGHLVDQLKTLGVTIDRGKMTWEQYIEALLAARTAHTKLSDAQEGAIGHLQDLIAKQARLDEELEKAKTVLEQAKKEYADNSISVDVLRTAQQEYDKALSAANGKVKQSAQDHKDLSLSMQGVINTASELQKRVDIAQKTFDDLSAAEDGSEKGAMALEIAANNLKIAINAVATATGEATGKHKSWAEAMEKGFPTFGPALDGISKALVGIVGDYRNVEVNGVQVLTRLTDAQEKALASLNRLYDARARGAENTRQVKTAEEEFTRSLGDTDAAQQGLTSTTENGVTVLRQHGEAAQTAAGTVLDFTTNLMAAIPVAHSFSSAVDGGASSLEHMAVAAPRASEGLKGLSKGLKGISNDLSDADISMQAFSSGMGSFEKSTGAALDAFKVWQAAAAIAMSPELQAFVEGPTTLVGGTIPHEVAVFNSQNPGPNAGTLTGRASGQSLSDYFGRAVAGVGSLTTATSALGTAATKAASSLDPLAQALVDAGSAYDTALADFQKGKGTADALQKASDAAQKANSAYMATATAANSAGSSIVALSDTLNQFSSWADVAATDPAWESLLTKLGMLTPKSTGSEAGGALMTGGEKALPPDPTWTAYLQSIGLLPKGNTGSEAGGKLMNGMEGSTGLDPTWTAFLRSLGVLSSLPVGYSADTPMSQGNGFAGGASTYQAQTAKAGANVTITMQYPNFNSQQQADQILKQITTQLRTITGQKLG